MRLKANVKSGLAILGAAAALIVLVGAAARSSDGTPGTGPGAHEGDDPAQVLGHVAEQTPGFEWTPEEEAKATPMPLLPPPWKTSDEG